VHETWSKGKLRFMAADSAAATYRWLAGLMVVLAVSGWGLFFVHSTTTAAQSDAQRIEFAQLKQERTKLEAEVQARKQGNEDLAALEAKLAAARDEVTRVTQAAEQARARLAQAQAAASASQSELTALGQKLADARAKEESASERTASVEPRKKASGRRHYTRRKKRR
jgi:peptidoglycan hydrolase CwlO-like protein